MGTTFLVAISVSEMLILESSNRGNSLLLFIQIPFVVAQNHPSSSITSHLNVCQSSIGFAVEGFDWLVQPQKLLI